MDDRKDTIPLFLAFCVEQYKNAQKISGERAYNALKDTGALNYLEHNYEVIHTQSPQWILEEINEYVNNHQN
jgi:hypothetical protein